MNPLGILGPSEKTLSASLSCGCGGLFRPCSPPSPDTASYPCSARGALRWPPSLAWSRGARGRSAVCTRRSGSLASGAELAVPGPGAGELGPLHPGPKPAAWRWVLAVSDHPAAVAAVLGHPASLQCTVGARGAVGPRPPRSALGRAGVCGGSYALDPALPALSCQHAQEAAVSLKAYCEVVNKEQPGLTAWTGLHSLLPFQQPDRIPGYVVPSSPFPFILKRHGVPGTNPHPNSSFLPSSPLPLYDPGTSWALNCPQNQVRPLTLSP